MKQWLKKITGVADLEEAARQAVDLKQKTEQEIAQLKMKEAEQEEATAAARRDHELAQMSGKERATAKQEPWINILDVKVNKDNIRNGFFEMDWNDYFIKELIFNGYGTDADPEEEIVDRWFRDIVYQMLEQEGLDTSRGAGYINIVPIDKGKSEIS